MPRNLDRRIEAMVPVDDPTLRQRLVDVLDINLADDTNAWEMHPDGTWTRVPTVMGISAQRQLFELAQERARRRRDEVGSTTDGQAVGLSQPLFLSDRG
jgi:polyphosphate kinase